MNRDEKAAVIDEIASQIKESEAIFAVDYRGISVPQAAELRTKLRDADTSFRVVKNSLTERAADEAGAQSLKALLEGPTALAFVRGDAAAAAKAIADYARATDMLPFKGGMLGAETLDAEQIKAISRLPTRDALYGQLVGIVASPISGLVRTLNALISGLAIQLGQIAEGKQSGEIPAGEAPAAEPAVEQAPATEAVEQAPVADEATAEEGEVPAAEVEAPAPAEEAAPETELEAEPETQTEPDPDPADNDNRADASGEADAEAKE